MSLSSDERAQVLGIAAKAHGASALIPTLRELAQAGRLDEIAEAIDVFTSGLPVNRTLARGFLTSRVPGILSNHYWPKASDPDLPDFNEFIEWSIKNESWADELRETVNSGGSLASEVARVNRSIKSRE